LRRQGEAQVRAVRRRVDAVAQVDPMHAAIQPQQQLPTAAHQRRVGMAVHARVEQLQGSVRSRQRHGHRGPGIRLQRDEQHIAVRLQLCLRHRGAVRCALRRLG
jgi:hypothetical protein